MFIRNLFVGKPQRGGYGWSDKPCRLQSKTNRGLHMFLQYNSPHSTVICDIKKNKLDC